MTCGEGSKVLPRLSSLEETVRFVEENDLGEYLEGMPEASFEVNLKERVRGDRHLHQQLETLAQARGLTPEELLDSWRREKLRALAPKP